MSCSPCYLAKAEDCPRALACLRFLEPNLVYETASLMLGRTADAAAAPESSPSAPVGRKPGQAARRVRQKTIGQKTSSKTGASADE
jgi:hypothetical protein